MENWDIEQDSEIEEEYWKNKIFEDRIDYNWLHYNPHMFFPNDEHFYRTGNISLINLQEKQPAPYLTPSFIVGCGRSGSTIVSKIISGHPDIALLSEPRLLWMQIFPNFDVWSSQASKREGSLRISRNLDSENSSKIANLFTTITSIVGKKSLVERTPENTFRLDWLDSLFPTCKFIMVKRNPIQIARSISRFQPHTWFGFDDYKWKKILEILDHYKVKSI